MAFRRRPPSAFLTILLRLGRSTSPFAASARGTCLPLGRWDGWEQTASVIAIASHQAREKPLYRPIRTPGGSGVGCPRNRLRFVLGATKRVIIDAWPGPTPGHPGPAETAWPVRGLAPRGACPSPSSPERGPGRPERRCRCRRGRPARRWVAWRPSGPGRCPGRSGRQSRRCSGHPGEHMPHGTLCSAQKHPRFKRLHGRYHGSLAVCRGTPMRRVLSLNWNRMPHPSTCLVERVADSLDVAGDRVTKLVKDI